MSRPTLRIAAALACLALCAADAPRPERGQPPPVEGVTSRRVALPPPGVGPPIAPASAPVAGPGSAAKPAPAPWLPNLDDFRALKGVALIGLISVAPAAVLMFTSFVRINIVLLLLRQALGSPQVPGNQVLTALAILLSALVMRPVAEQVYTTAVRPYAEGELSLAAAWTVGTTPIKVFMVHQIERTGHLDYLRDLHDVAEPPRAGRAAPQYPEEFPLRAVAPAFLISELTTALTIGFLIYLPFLVVDLVVSAVLSAMGLFMLPPSLVAMPLKLILFVLADGWMLVASALLRTFAIPTPG